MYVIRSAERGSRKTKVAYEDTIAEGKEEEEERRYHTGEEVDSADDDFVSPPPKKREHAKVSRGRRK